MHLPDFITGRISRKISIAILLAVIAILGAFEGYQYARTESLAQQELNALAKRTLTRLGQNLELPLWEVDATWVKKVVDTEMEDNDIFAIVVSGEGDIHIARTRDSQWQTVDAESEIKNGNLEYKMEVYRNDEQIGDVTLYITQRFMDERLRADAASALSEALFLSVVLLIFLRLILHRLIIFPLRTILTAAKSIARGEYGRTIELRQSDEIGKLADEFNNMQDKVQRRETERDQALTLLEQDKERTKAQLELTLSSFDSELELIAYAVDEFVRITQSQCGYLHFFNHANETIQAYAWSSGYTQHGDNSEAASYPLKEEGAWADAIRLKKPIIHNVYIQRPIKDVVLDSKQPLSRHMSVPILSSGEVVGVAGVGNREESYQETDAEILSLFVNTLWYLVEKGRSTAELSELRHYLQNVFDSMPSVLVGVEPDGHIIHWNLGAEQFTGVDSTEAQGKVVDKVLPLLSEKMQAVERAIKEGAPQQMERVVHMENGESHYADIMIYPLVTNAHVGAVIRIDDVTERVRVEEMMVQTEKMMSVGGLAAGMAHEINNPLGGILQGQQNIRRRLSPELNKNLEVARELGLDLEAVKQYMERRQILHFLDEIAKAGERAGAIVENMLHFSRKDENKLPVDITALLDQVLELAAVDYDLKKKYDFRSIEIQRDYEPGLPSVSCISSEIQQVLLNILRNSAQALQEVPQREEAPRIVVGAHHDPYGVRIDITDNGPGMGEESRKRAFEPFYTTKPPGQGTGLGLSVSYFIITDSHGGKMSLESEPGKGTKLSILLPPK